MRHPWGPCGFIFPWNFPMLLIGWGISPALAAGNTVVIKPAEDTPLSAIYFARLAKEVGIPDGVINVVPGYGNVTGRGLGAHRGLRRISFTGSPEVGRLIAAACGRNLVPVKLELGGKGAAVVFDDVDLPQTVEKLVAAITFHAGQVCCDATRWLVQRPIYQQFLERAVERLQKVVVGYQMDAQSQMGPLVSQKQRAPRAGLPRRGGCAKGPAAAGWRPGPSARPRRFLRQAGLAGRLAGQRGRPRGDLRPGGLCHAVCRRGRGDSPGQSDRLWAGQQRVDPRLGRAARVAEAMVAGNSWINGHNLFPAWRALRRREQERHGRGRAGGGNLVGLLAQPIGAAADRIRHAATGSPLPLRERAG